MAIGSSADDYTQALIQLAPKGAAWLPEINKNWFKLLDALAVEFSRIDANLVLLIEEAFPDTTSAMLENWERIAGLPDECSGLAPTESERRGNLLAKLRARGGQSVEYFISVIEALGYTITIDEFTPFIIDESMMGDPLADEEWYFVFRVNAPDAIPDHDAFECILNRIKPAHTLALFSYT